MSDAAEQPAHLLRSVELRRFKAAYETGAIDLQPFTVLIGRNGSGKSTLLEALQWIDTALRNNTYVACERYAPIADIINLRAESRQSFRLRLTWSSEPDAEPWTYTLEVGTPDGNSVTVENEELMRGRTNAARYAVRSIGGLRQYHSEGTWLPVSAPEKLALGELPRHKQEGFLHDLATRSVSPPEPEAAH